MRRHLAVFVLFASALLLAATPKPLGTPAPKAPSASASAPAANQPVVVVYPFEAPSDLDARYGTAIAQIYSQVMAQSGGVTVLAIPKGILREDYQKYAHVLHADYYISGYIEPIGQAAAIVAQVVDVANDISVYSTTTQITNVQDVASQALNARTVILEAAGVERPELEAAGPAASPTPESSSGASVPISNVLTDLFKGRPKGKPTPTPSPKPIKPRRGAIVVRLTGNAPGSELTVATGDLYRAMDAHFTTAMSSIVTENLSKSADSICGTYRDNTIASGVLSVTHVGGFRPHDTYTFTFSVYACFGAVLYSDTQTNDNYERAIKNAVDQYFTEHPENNG